MISTKLLNPSTIAVIGGSDDVTKTGGKVLKNLLRCGFNGEVYVVNPKSPVVQGLDAYADVNFLPQTDLAIIAVAARFCVDIVRTLAHEKGTRGFIILSAGFGEESAEGASFEKEIAKIIDSVGGTLIGPNCIGFLNNNYAGVFTEPIPTLASSGVDFISGSGATAVFIMETAIRNGLSFSSVWSVGNSAQTGIEDVLEHLDETFDPERSSTIKLLYIESIRNPAMLLKHASSLVRKGCRIAAIKAGTSDAGSRAASSHTGAMATPDAAVTALFRKAGIVRCFSRAELATAGAIFTYPALKGKKMAVITHAGGPAVMLTDALSEGGIEVPHLEGKAAERLLEKLFPGSSTANPIDFLATGTAEQLGHIIDACEKDFGEIDAMAVIFGSPGLFPVDEVYNLLHSKIRSCSKPLFPIMPSVINAGREIGEFIAKGNAMFHDEVLFGNTLCRICNTPPPADAISEKRSVRINEIRAVIKNSQEGYLSPAETGKLLKAAGIRMVEEAVAANPDEAVRKASEIGFPVVMKVIGPVHKSDVGGVALDVRGPEKAGEEFRRMIALPDVTGILIQPMLRGRELYCGAKREDGFGHIIMAGLGGVFIELIKDVSTALVPVSESEALSMVRSLKSYSIFRGVRGEKGIDEAGFVRVITSLSKLLEAAPEIYEADINPLIASSDGIVAVDARINVVR